MFLRTSKTTAISTLLISATASLTGCHGNPQEAAHISAYDPSGHSSEPWSEEKREQLNEHGMLISFKAGDEIKMVLDIDSHLVEAIDDQTLRVKQPFYFYMYQGLPQVSTDLTEWDTNRTHGSIGISLSVKSKKKANELTISLGTEPKNP